MKIILVCAYGTSTSILAKKMREAAAAEGIELEISAHTPVEVQGDIGKADIILLGPQVSYQKDAIQKVQPDIPVEAVSMMDYGMMNGKKILSDVITLLKERG